MNNTPWCHHIKWDEDWIKFVEKLEKSIMKSIFGSLKNKVSTLIVNNPKY